MTLEDRVKQFIESNQPCTLDQIVESVSANKDVIKLALHSLDSIEHRYRRYRVKGTSNREVFRIIAKRLDRPVSIAELSEMSGVSKTSTQCDARRVLNLVGDSKRNGKRIGLYSFKAAVPKEQEKMKSVIHLLKMRTDQSIGIQYYTRFQFI
jgi:hypothetical protein